MFNKLADKCNADGLRQLIGPRNPLFQVMAKDSSKDTKIKDIPKYLFANKSDSETGNLPTCLKFCNGVRIMLLRNIDTEDKLINGSLGSIKFIQKSVDDGKPSGTIFVMFDDDRAGSKLKRKSGRLKGCVPIVPVTTEFTIQRGAKKSSMLVIERKQFPLKVAEAMTVHKAQGSGFDYMSADLNQVLNDKKRGIQPGMIYTLLSRATARSRLKLLNFTGRDQISINRHALHEIWRLRKEAVEKGKLYQHPIENLNSSSICLYKISSWDRHIHHFFMDNVLVSRCSLILLTDTGSQNENLPDMNWIPLHCTVGCISICYDSTKVRDVERQGETVSSSLIMLSYMMTINEERTLILLVYQRPQLQTEDANATALAMQNFANELRIQRLFLEEFIEENDYRTLVVGSFNLPHDSQHILNEALPQDKFKQRCRFPTNANGSITELVFDNHKSDSVEWMPSPYSQNFILMFE